MQESEKEKFLRTVELEESYCELQNLKDKLALAEAIVSSAHGEDVNALALADDILEYFGHHGHSLSLNAFPPSPKVLEELAKKVGPALQYDPDAGYH